ncbi:hypothetical protein FBY58_1799 [Zymomonas mobilis]|uniref:Uncharacterized protein n=1 Tax=Zymomonas mobilis TaxID=542 RepID=A0A542VUJ3_ZYMMB|nr:hypothetical protein FBY58_1799 [Zymomonas mobilis]
MFEPIRVSKNRGVKKACSLDGIERNVSEKTLLK